MSPCEKADIVSAMTIATYELALAGIRHRYPESTAQEQFLRLALITLGPDLARRRLPGDRPAGPGVSSIPDPIDIALVVARELEAAGVAYTVGGSIASSVAGEPRSTIDIDIVAAIDAEQVPGLVVAFSPEFYVNDTRYCALCVIGELRI